MQGLKLEDWEHDTPPNLRLQIQQRRKMLKNASKDVRVVLEYQIQQLEEKTMKRNNHTSGSYNLLNMFFTGVFVVFAIIGVVLTIVGTVL